MAEKSKKSTKNQKDNKNLIICICGVVAVAIAIIIAVIVVNLNNINDSYFVSDGSKYVLTIEADESDSEDQYAPLKTHLVYTYNGDTVTGMKTYYVYGDGNSAKNAFDALKKELGDEANKMELNGKYIIITAEEDSYKDLKASEVKEQIEFMEKLQNMDLDDADDADDDSTDTELEEDDTKEDEE